MPLPMPMPQDVLREELMAQLMDNHILLVTDPIDSIEAGDPEDLRCTVTCGKRRFRPEVVLYSGGRDANSEGLGLEEAGIRCCVHVRFSGRHRRAMKEIGGVMRSVCDMVPHVLWHWPTVPPSPPFSFAAGRVTASGSTDGLKWGPTTGPISRTFLRLGT